MLLLINSFITEKRAPHLNRYSRLDIFKYTLFSYKNIDFKELYFFIDFDDEYKFFSDIFLEYIYFQFKHVNKDKIHFFNKRLSSQKDWIPFMELIINSHGLDELILFLNNDDHVFIDFDNNILNEGLRLLKNEPNDHKSIYISHWPEILKLSGKYNTPILLNNYIKFEATLLDSIQIFNIKYLKTLYIDYIWKSDHIRLDTLIFEFQNEQENKNNYLKQVIYVPLREMFRKFNGYNHIIMEHNACPQLKLPINIFIYNKETLLKNMSPYHSSQWTNNNTFKIPELWIDINLNLHNNIEKYELKYEE